MLKSKLCCFILHEGSINTLSMGDIVYEARTLLLFAREAQFHQAFSVYLCPKCVTLTLFKMLFRSFLGQK